jgi:hypothetical protein
VRGALRVEDENGAHRRRFARGRGEPARRERRDVGDRENDRVLFDDALVEAIDFLVGDRERGLDDRLLA